MKADRNIRTYSQARDYLEGLIPVYKAKYPFIGLGRMRALLDEMGNPQDSYATVHIGGTAGKTSTATMVAAMLHRAGYRTGLHISPHLQDIRERAQINGSLMPEKEFVRMTKDIRKYVDIVDENYGYGLPSYFEALVALAFQHFKEKKVDIAVVEVGLGGTLDGTNVIRPKVAVLTNVGLDHTEILGNTVEKIARDKVGIFKDGIDVISGVTKPSVVKIVEKQANDLHCRLDLLGRDIRYSIRDENAYGSIFDLSIGRKKYSGIRIGAVGDHQITNACLAVDAVLKLKKHGFGVSDRDIRNVLNGINIHGRFEKVKDSPVVILDGAHSPMKMAALARTLKQDYPGRKVRFIFAVKKRKDSAAMLRIISRLSSKFYFTRFVATTDFGKRMSQEPKGLKALTKVQSEAFEYSADAYRKAVSEASDGEIICITGSLYLVGEMRDRLVRGKPTS